MSPNRANAGQVTQQSADNGIDGIINEDPLGLDTIYLQAKRWQDPVGEGPIRDFIGALVIKGVKKGVFLTTSYFTPAARAAVQGNKSDQKIVLIDGARLAALMIEHNPTVSLTNVASTQMRPNQARNFKHPHRVLAKHRFEFGVGMDGAFVFRVLQALCFDVVPQLFHHLGAGHRL